jgi:uncharacterized protein YybS (DUF2232 family)
MYVIAVLSLCRALLSCLLTRHVLRAFCLKFNRTSESFDVKMFSCRVVVSFLVCVLRVVVFERVQVYLSKKDIALGHKAPHSLSSV